MQAVTRSKQFVIDHRIITVAVSVVAFVAIVSGAALLITTGSADQSNGVAAAVDAGVTSEQFNHPTDRPASMSGVAPLDTSNGDPDSTYQMSQYLLSTEARQSALTTQASDRAIWTAFPGHAGFTASDGEQTVTLTRTYFPGHAGFTP